MLAAGVGVACEAAHGTSVNPDPLFSASLLQSALVFINTIFLQRVLEGPEGADRLGDEDRRALTPPFWIHVSPYATFRLDITTRLPLDRAQPVEG